jgi:uncharacterized protein (TIGR03435 family)
MRDRRYEIIAKVPEGATGDQFRLMIQNMLIDRFQLLPRPAATAHKRSRRIIF